MRPTLSHLLTSDASSEQAKGSAASAKPIISSLQSYLLLPTVSTTRGSHEMSGQKGEKSSEAHQSCLFVSANRSFAV